MTSRRRLAGLEGAHAHALDLDLLPLPDAVELLGRVAGSGRLAAEPGAGLDIVSCCGRLPLAVRIAGARLAAAPYTSLAELAGRLADERRRLAELTAGDLDVRSSFGLSYHALAEPARRAFRLLSVTDAPDMTAWLAAALLGSPHAAAEEVLDVLTSAQLLDTVGRDSAGQLRYRQHDLLRIYAQERFTEEEAPGVRVAALLRAVRAAVARVRWATYGAQTDRPARDWLTAERVTLVGIVAQAFTHGLAALGWQLVGALEEFFETGSYFDDWQHTQRLALAAARRVDDVRQEARAHSRLATVLWLANQWTEARHHAEVALPELRRLGDRREEARALRTLGRLCHEQGSWAEAITHLGESEAILAELGDRRELAKTACEIGVRHRFRADPVSAIAYFDRAIELYQAVGDRYDAAGTRVQLACAHRDRGDFDRAVTDLSQALAELVEFGDRDGQAQALFQLAVTHRRCGDDQRALPYFQESLRLARQLGQRLGEGMILLNVAELHIDCGRLVQARWCLDHSMHIFHELDSPYWRGRAFASLGRLYAHSGQSRPAHEAWRQAVRLLEPLGAPEVGEIAELLSRPQVDPAHEDTDPAGDRQQAGARESKRRSHGGSPSSAGPA